MIKLIKGDPQEIYKDAIVFHEEITGTKLTPADEKAHIYSTISVLLGDILYGANDIALQNYTAFARGERLDMKAKIFGTRAKRLEASYAKVIMKCSISQIVNRIVYIKKGTRFIHGENIFISLEEGRINPGEIETNILAQAEKPGDIGEILAGEITQIVDRYDYYESCINPQDVSNGGNEENDDNYRVRLEELPESFTSAGSEGSYIYWTKQVSSEVTQVKIEAPSPNVLDIYVYGKGKKISDEEKEAIKTYLTEKDRLPLNDLVNIKDPIFNQINLEIDYYLYSYETRPSDEIKKSLLLKLNDYFNSLKIGEGFNPQDVIQILKNDGIKRCDIKSLLITSETTKISLIICNSITLNYMGAE